MTGGPWLKADFDANLDRARAAACATRARSPVESREGHPCSRPGAAAKSGWSEGHKEVPFESQGYLHGSRKQGQVTSRTKAGSRLLLEPRLRWFRMGPYKGSTRPGGHISCPARRPSTADQKVSLQSPQTPSQTRCGRPAPSRGRARRANAKPRLLKHDKHGACGAPAQFGPRDAAAAPRMAAALDGRRESKHTKSREARAVAATSDEDGHQLIQNFARTQA